MKEIELKDIEQFSKIYNSNVNNKNLENQIKQYGLDKVCINKEIIDENPPSFNIELEETKRYDQKDSLRCWAFSGINVIKRNMAKNLNIDIMNFELSDNFIIFFHRLEKANTTYEKILTSKTTDLSKIFKKNILKNPVEEVGNWKTFVGIVKKYGLVPMTVMPITIEGENSSRVTNLFSETVRSYAITLLELKKQNKNIEELRKIKLKMLADNYEFLSKVYGEPVKTFNYNYIDKDRNNVTLKNTTPNQFVEQFLSIDIENFVFISNVPKKNRKYGEKLKNLSSININKMKYVEFLHISAQELKELSIKQLKDNIPVMVGIYIRKFADKISGVLDTRLYDYESLVKYKNLNKEDGMLLGDIELHHWMTITGVQIEEGSPKRWKVEDSYGDKEKVNGYYIMNDNYFDKYVFTVIIDKKYLSKKQLELYNQKGIIEDN
ncbi:MAG: hypothetical protein HFJ19_00280 [Clostridia bacterium]|nr:hypothetical protein [Clostridia bacterium]